MVLRPTTAALCLASLIGICSTSAAYAQGSQFLALNTPVSTASDPAMQQAVEILSNSPRIKSSQSKRGTIFHSRPANDFTVVKHKKDLDKVRILGGAEVIPM